MQNKVTNKLTSKDNGDINGKIERNWLEKYILEGDLSAEYLKPYLTSNFNINE